MAYYYTVRQVEMNSSEPSDGWREGVRDLLIAIAIGVIGGFIVALFT